MRILIIEDEQKLAQALQESLSALHYEVALAASGEDGFYLANTQKFDVVILDLNLPGRDGIEILRSLRQQGQESLILVLTARDSLEDRVLGLDCGADDYLVKPFAFPELHARLRALTRRGRSEEQIKICCGGLEVDRLARSVSREGRPIELTSKEFDLLELLARHQGHVISREMIARELWGERARALTLDNVIDVHVARLRTKVDAPFERPLIHTLRGLGFVLREDG